MKNGASRYLVLFFVVFSHLAHVRAQDAGGKSEAGFTEREVTFFNGEVRLAASLLLPDGDGPHPTAVFIQGSGSSDRSNRWTTAYARSLAKRGIAVLHPDKRGSGKSNGTWYNASFETLAGDTIAAVNFITGIPDVDNSKIGVIGFSQGGHIAPIVAAKSPRVKFAVSVSGSTVPMLEQIMDEVEIAAERAGLNEDQIVLVNQINKTGIEYALTGKGKDAYLKLLRKAKSGELKDSEVVTSFPTEPNPGTIAFLKAIQDFDPIRYWEKVSVRSLFVYGGRDRNVRTNKSINRLNKVFGKSNFDYGVLMFHKEGHGIFSDEVVEFIKDWISSVNQ